jgi:hypothetical protein
VATPKIGALLFDGWEGTLERPASGGPRLSRIKTVLRDSRANCEAAAVVAWAMPSASVYWACTQPGGATTTVRVVDVVVESIRNTVGSDAVAVLNWTLVRG